MIKVSSLTVALSGNVVVDNVSFDVGDGCFCAIIGPNGAGKTTLLRAMMGLVRPLSGLITFTGKKAIGYVPQRFLFERNFPISCYEVVFSGRIAKGPYYRMPTRKDKEIVDSAMKRLEVQEIARRPFGEISGGQQQRVLIARALAAEPTVILFDEPESNLDPKAAEGVLQTLYDLSKEGMTVILVTHDVGAVFDKLDCVYYLNKKILAKGGPTEISDELDKLYGPHFHKV